ncbi:hypothetical protein EA459_05255 [Streptococcus dysgalactiae subsp. dysgalactiae]|nr:hypothetical protein [Streptococcus dysgalactiae]QGG98045.1 hypothetical protein EA459_05255 [Streptococcus dysgalactiae subsp. dysgalactiae]
MEKEQVKQIYFTIKQEAELHGYKEIENHMEFAIRSSAGGEINLYSFGLDVVLPLLTNDDSLLKQRDIVRENRTTFKKLYLEHATKVRDINLSNHLTTRAKREMSIEVRESFVNQFSKLENGFNRQKKEFELSVKKLLDIFIEDFKKYYTNIPELIYRIRSSFNYIEEYKTDQFANDIYLVPKVPTSYKDVDEYIGNMFANVARIHKIDPNVFIRQIKEDAEKSNLLEEEYLIKAYLDCKEEYEEHLISLRKREEEAKKANPTPEPKSSIVSKALNKLMGGIK